MLTLLISNLSYAFCGTYVGPADTKLYNEGSRVAIARQGTLTTLTMSVDYCGEADRFALIIPVPELPEGSVSVVDPEVLDAIDRYSAPRLVSYTCDNLNYGIPMADSSGIHHPQTETAEPETSGVTVEAQYAAGEYDITVLSATGANGLLDWLQANGYAVSTDLEHGLQQYIDQGNAFIAAKVRLESNVGVQDLPPLQFSYSSNAWSLPIALGLHNAQGAQHATIFTLTGYADGFTGISNYPEVTIEDECLVEETEVGQFYRSSLSDAIADAGGMGWLREYSWTAATCDPCPDEPMTDQQTRQLGFLGSAAEAVVTRLHVAYSADNHHGDIQLYNTGINAAHQSRYIAMNEELAGDFPVCGEGWIEGAKECPTRRNGCQSRALSATFIGLLGLGRWRRRS